MTKQNLRNSTRWSDGEIKQMIDLYESGLTLEEVGAKFGVTKQRIAVIFKKAAVITSTQTEIKLTLIRNSATDFTFSSII